MTKTSEGEWRLSGVVDLENAVAGDALLDMAKTFFYGIGESRVKREGFFKVFKGYGEIDRSQWNEQIDLYRHIMHSNGGVGPNSQVRNHPHF